LTELFEKQKGGLFRRTVHIAQAVV